MNSAAEKVVIVEPEPNVLGPLLSAMRGAGFNATAYPTPREAIEAVRDSGADLLLLDGAAPEHAPAFAARDVIAAIRGSSATERVRVILLVGSTAEERAAALDSGADDAISQPWSQAELLARVRTQLHARRADQVLIDKAQLAEEGQKIAHTAFDALAVTEKMTQDAVSLNRRLKLGVASVLAIAVVMAAIYFLFVRKTSKEIQLSSATISRLERGLMHQEDLMAQARKLRESQAASPAPILEPAPGKTLRPGAAATSIISEDVQSVCLLHVSVAFRNTQTGQRLRYAGLNQQGDPLQDSEGSPILTLAGNGPEVKLDVFGTGFFVGPDGRIITNRHVAEPWWKNEELGNLSGENLQAEISSIHAYFPGDPRAFTADIEDISKDADLATMHVHLQDLKRLVLSIDPSKEASQPGEPIVLMGYATGLAAILARTDEDTAQQIVKQNSGDPSRVLDELARRNLIRPLITQGHIGDVLADKIVFDAQTTSGGSGGPLFNQQGKVIGVTYAVLAGFGGSNFGIPIRFSEPLLAGAAKTGPN
jgi:DNA-binding response OmpR family regulator/S1-C subfamily serine protease